MATQRILTNPTLVVPEDELQAYSNSVVGMDIFCIPPSLVGVSKVRNWIVSHFPEECIVMYDDDVTAMQTICALHNRRLPVADIEAVVENTAYCAAGAGARLFGWNQRPDPRVLQRNDPFSVANWCGGVVGVIGKEIRWDELLRFKCDIDACLAELRDNRIVWHERRFCFLQGRDKNPGGNSRFRSPESIEAEKRYLAGKWKAHITLDEYQSQDRVRMNVERKQKFDL